jgi:hypothetical protein
MSFRSDFREHAPQFMLLKAKASLEDARYVGKVTRELLQTRTDLVGL